MTSDTVTLPIATARDYDTLGAVMHDAIRNGPSLYTPDQQVAWSPAPRQGEAWATRLSGKMVLMAERGGKALGFGADAHESVELNGQRFDRARMSKNL